MNAINRIANMILGTEIEVFQIDSILVGIAIIYLKSTQDIFQGINKLDHLLKVSIFQKYKNKKLENQKNIFFTDFDDEVKSKSGSMLSADYAKIM